MDIVTPTEANTDTNTRFVVCESLADFASLEPSWNQLALPAGSPFLTHEWLRSWWRAFGEKGGMAGLLLGVDGGLLAGAGLIRRSGRVAEAAANAYSDAWDVVAADEDARRLLFREVAALSGARLRLSSLPADSPSAAIAHDTLTDAGYRVAVGRQQWSPYIPLPGTWEQLLATLSSNSRSQIRKKRRRIGRQGRVLFRSTTSRNLDRDLDSFFRLEASGWKGAADTAILKDPRVLRLYTDFAHAAADPGWLRIDLLELDGVAIAADYSCVMGETIFVLKTGFDERYARMSPGVVLRTESIRAAIEQGLSLYEWLGAPDAYKLHWGGGLRERLLISAYRGYGLPAFLYRHKVRPAARRLREFTRAPGAGRGGRERARLTGGGLRG